jgi:hypothetical protein
MLVILSEAKNPEKGGHRDPFATAAFVQGDTVRVAPVIPKSAATHERADDLVKLPPYSSKGKFETL